MAHTAYPTKSKALLWAVITGVAAALGYLIAELFMQHDLGWAPFGMLFVFAFVALFSYILNVRHVPKKGSLGGHS